MPVLNVTKQTAIIKMKKQDSPSCLSCDSIKNSVFGELDNKNLGCLDSHKTCNLYKKGQVIFHEGNRPLGLYCLKQGKVKIYKTGIDGREQIVRLVKPGELLGYRAFLGEEFYSASAASIEDAVVCFIDKNDFHTVLHEDEKLSWNLIQILTRELREAENLLRDMAQKTVRERLAEVLLLIKQKYGVDQSDSTLLSAHLSRDELASFVGTATETLIRLLSDMKAEGVIETEGKRIRILDTKALAEIANIEF